MIRKFLAALMLSALGLGVARAEQMAMGLIVKMKDAQPASVVRLRATLQQTEQPYRLRQRLAAAANRTRVSYLVERQTAFAAHLIHHGRPVPLSEARAEAERLRKDPDVEWVAVNEIEQRQAVASNDPLYGQQSLLVDASTGGRPNIPAAWATLSSLPPLSQIVIAVLDTGVIRHPDLNDQRVLFGHGYDFVSERDYSNDGNGLDDDATDPGDYLTQVQINADRGRYQDCGTAHNSSWHGTSVTGLLAATVGNGTGIAGMMPAMTNAPTVLPVRVASQCGAAVIDIIEGILWAAGIQYNGMPKVNNHPARVINLSFGGDGGCACDRTSSLLTGACLYQDAIAAIKQKGAILVAAAGNASSGNQPGSAETSRPASCPGALAVTALNVNGRKAEYANLAPSSGIATLGGDPAYGDPGIVTTSNSGATEAAITLGLPNDDYILESGTSFSTPVAAGAVALMLAVNPNLSVDQLLAGLRDPLNGGVRSHVTGGAQCSASNRGSCTCTTATCGAGILDVDRAVRWAAAAPPDGSYVAQAVSVGFFDANKLRNDGPSSSNATSGGGGGVVDTSTILAAAGIGMWLLVGRWFGVGSSRAGRKLFSRR